MNDEIPCKLPWSRILVYADGSFKHCCYMSKPVANINDGPFSEVWNNTNSRRIREALLKGELDHEFCICIESVGRIPDLHDPDPHIQIKNNTEILKGSYVQVQIEKKNEKIVTQDGLYCDGGSNWFSIGSEGNVYKCNALMYSEKGYLGNIFTDELNISGQTFSYCPIQQCQQVCDRHWSQKQIIEGGVIIDKEDVVDRKHYKGKSNPVSMLWAPSWKCNYTCKYCHLPTGHKEYKSHEWIKAFGKFLDLNKIDGGILHTNGGEPMFYKGILDIFQYMIQRGFVIAITTNLSIDIQPLIKAVPAGGIADISASLHVTDSNFSWPVFKERVVTLHKLGYRISVNFVAHPDYVPLIPEYHNFFTKQHGIEFCVIPMIGGWSGVEFASINDYPDHLRSVLKQYVKADLQDDNRFKEGDRVTQLSLPVLKTKPIDIQINPGMNTIRTAGYNSSDDKINPVMTKELFDFIAERSSTYNVNSDTVSDWLCNREVAINERNSRKINLTCKPLYLDIELNNMCNLYCEFCSCVHGHVRDAQNPEAMLTKNEIDKISHLFKWAEVMETSKAGEPFISPELFVYALEKIRSLNPFVIIHTVTNGTILTDKLLNSLIQNKLDHMYISISGDTQENYKQIMGGDMFDKVISNLSKIQEAKAKKASSEPYLHFNTQLAKFNDPIIMLEMAHQYGVIEVNFVKTQMTSGNVRFKGGPVQDYMTGDEIEKLMKQIVTKANELQISINFPGWPKRNDVIVGSPARFYYPHVTKYFDLDLICPTDAPWFRFCTSMRKVQPCCWSGGFADWTTESFESIWNGKYLQDLRQQLSSGKYPNVCHCRY